LGDVPYRSLWVYIPHHSHRSWDNTPEYFERSTATRPAQSRSVTLPWTSRTHADFGAAVGGSVVRYPGPLYTVDLIQRVIRAGGEPVEVVADPGDLAGLIDACVTLAGYGESEPGEDGRVMSEAARFIAGRARTFDGMNRGWVPESTDAVVVQPVEFDAKTWRLIDRLAE
jgi:hypothetical protein